MIEHERYEGGLGWTHGEAPENSQMIDTYNDAPDSQNCILIDGLIIICHEQVSTYQDLDA